jgi:hypothetical protein
MMNPASGSLSFAWRNVLHHDQCAAQHNRVFAGIARHNPWPAKTLGQNRHQK